MSDPIDDILIDGETVLWRGQPDFARAKHRPSTWRQRRRGHLVWIAGFAAIFALVVLAGDQLRLGDMRSWLILVLVIILALQLWAYFAHSPKPQDLVTEPPTYIVTDRRVIEIAAPELRTSAFATGVAATALKPNGAVYDVSVYAPVEDLHIGFQAIADGPAVEKLIIETLAPKQGPVS